MYDIDDDGEYIHIHRMGGEYPPSIPSPQIEGSSGIPSAKDIRMGITKRRGPGSRRSLQYYYLLLLLFLLFLMVLLPSPGLPAIIGEE